MSTEDMDLDLSTATDEQVVAKASQLGWADKPDWRGNEADWVDARTFLEKGTTVLPMLRKNLDKTLAKTTQLEGRLTAAETALRAANAALAAIEDERVENNEADLIAQKASLQAEIEEASKDGRHGDVAAKTAELAEVIASEKIAQAVKGQKPANGDRGAPAQPHPEIVAWRNDNPAFIANPRKMALATVIAQELRTEGDTSTGRAFMDKVAEKVEKELGGGPSHSRVGAGGGGRRSEGGGGGASKTYADLPVEAKLACDKMEARVVGKGKKHADVGSWRKSYCAQYFKE